MTMRDRAERADADELGASAVEYALLITLIAVVIFAAVLAVGGQAIELFKSVNWWSD